MKDEKFQEIIDDLNNTESIWDWNDQDSSVTDNIQAFLKEKSSSAQITEYIETLSCLDIRYDHENISYACKEILDNDSSVETLTTVIKTLSNLGNKEYYRDDISEVFIKIIDEHPERVDQIRTLAQKNGFDGVFAHKMFSEPKMLKMLETVNTALKNNDKKALNKFRAKLAKMSDKEIFQIDHAAMEFLVNNFTQENFDKVNNLRAFWGLKTVISEESLTEKNLRDIRRMEFSHSVSETDESNPHYSHTYSDAYKDFVPDYTQSFEREEYNDVIASSPAAQMLKEHGFSSFVQQLPDVFEKAHVPPSLVPKLCVKDMQHLLIEYHSDEISNRERRSIFDLNEVDIQHEAYEVRATFWKEVVKDKDLIKFISNDLKKKGIDKYNIEKMWQDARECGNPNANVRSVFFNVHHRVALKDGGTNTPDNFVIVIRMPGVVDSHSPLHEYDNPLIHLYKHKDVGEDGVIISDKKRSKKDVEIRLNTVFVADEENMHKNINKKVLYYGGPHSSSYIGKVHQTVRLALNNIDRIYQKISEKVKNKKLHKKKQPVDSQKTSSDTKAISQGKNDIVSIKPVRQARKARKATGEYGE